MVGNDRTILTHYVLSLMEDGGMVGILTRFSHPRVETVTTAHHPRVGSYGHFSKLM